MYNIKPSSSKFIAKQCKDIDKGKFKPSITTKIDYPLDDKNVAAIEITYAINITERQNGQLITNTFAAATNSYSILKESEKNLHSSRTVYCCIKRLESDLNNYLRIAGKTSLQKLGVRPLSYSNWLKYNPQNGIIFTLN